MNEIKFSKNWNNKLDCECFTTIRLRNLNKYKVGKNYKISLKASTVKIDKGEAKLIAIRNLKNINSINEFIARIDTGLSKDECISTIKSFYYRHNFDWDSMEISLLLFQKIRYNVQQKNLEL